MASEGILEIIRDFEKEVEERLRHVDEVMVDLFELREDERNFLKDLYGKKYDVRSGLSFSAPGNPTPHNYVVIRHKKA